MHSIAEPNHADTRGQWRRAYFTLMDAPQAAAQRRQRFVLIGRRNVHENWSPPAFGKLRALSSGSA